jgi:hypothetical protein
MLPGAIPVTFWSRARLLDRFRSISCQAQQASDISVESPGTSSPITSRLHASRVGALRHASALRQEARVAGRRRALAKGPIDPNCHTAFD